MADDSRALELELTEKQLVGHPARLITLFKLNPSTLGQGFPWLIEYFHDGAVEIYKEMGSSLLWLRSPSHLPPEKIQEEFFHGRLMNLLLNQPCVPDRFFREGYEYVSWSTETLPWPSYVSALYLGAQVDDEYEAVGRLQYALRNALNAYFGLMILSGSSNPIGKDVYFDKSCVTSGLRLYAKLTEPMDSLLSERDIAIDPLKALVTLGPANLDKLEPNLWRYLGLHEEPSDREKALFTREKFHLLVKFVLIPSLVLHRLADEVTPALRAKLIERMQLQQAILFEALIKEFRKMLGEYDSGFLARQAHLFSQYIDPILCELESSIQASERETLNNQACLLMRRLDDVLEVMSSISTAFEVEDYLMKMRHLEIWKGLEALIDEQIQSFEGAKKRRSLEHELLLQVPLFILVNRQALSGEMGLPAQSDALQNLIHIVFRISRLSSASNLSLWRAESGEWDLRRRFDALIEAMGVTFAKSGVHKPSESEAIAREAVIERVAKGLGPAAETIGIDQMLLRMLGIVPGVVIVMDHPSNPQLSSHSPFLQSGLAKR